MTITLAEAAAINPVPWKAIALVVFLAIWVAVAIRVTLRKRGAYDHAAQIPLNDEYHGAAR